MSFLLLFLEWVLFEWWWNHTVAAAVKLWIPSYKERIEIFRCFEFSRLIVVFARPLTMLLLLQKFRGIDTTPSFAIKDCTASASWWCLVWILIMAGNFHSPSILVNSSSRTIALPDSENGGGLPYFSVKKAGFLIGTLQIFVTIGNYGLRCNRTPLSPIICCYWGVNRRRSWLSTISCGIAKAFLV